MWFTRDVYYNNLGIGQSIATLQYRTKTFLLDQLEIETSVCAVLHPDFAKSLSFHVLKRKRQNLVNSSFLIDMVLGKNKAHMGCT